MSYIKSIPTHEKLFAVGQSGPNATLKPIKVVLLGWLGLAWPWVGEFVGFTIIFVCLLTHPNLVHRKHPVNFRLIFTSITLARNIILVRYSNQSSNEYYIPGQVRRYTVHDILKSVQSAKTGKGARGIEDSVKKILVRVLRYPR